MAPELENYWFERRRKGRRCGTKAIAWQGRVLTAVYSAVVALAAAFLVERTVVGFVATLAVATAVFFVLVSAKTRGGVCGRGGGA